MSLTLTEEQLRVLDSEAGTGPRVIDPRTNMTYVLVPEADFEAVREILEDERRQKAIREIAIRNAVSRMDEGP